MLKHRSFECPDVLIISSPCGSGWDHSGQLSQDNNQRECIPRTAQKSHYGSVCPSALPQKPHTALHALLSHHGSCTIQRIGRISQPDVPCAVRARVKSVPLDFCALDCSLFHLAVWTEPQMTTTFAFFSNLKFVMNSCMSIWFERMIYQHLVSRWEKQSAGYIEQPGSTALPHEGGRGFGQVLKPFLSRRISQA